MQNIIITGASHGIGRAIAKKLSKKYHIINIDIVENGVVKVKKGDNVEEFFFDKLIFSKDEEYITIVLKENFKALVMDLKKEFSKHGLKEFFMLNGKYTKFLFMHLNRWKNYHDRLEWTEERLREKLKVPQNYNFSKIEERILEKARKEIVTKTEIYFDYEIERQTKTVQFKVYKLEEKFLEDYLKKIDKKNYDELTEIEKKIYDISLKAKKEREGKE